MTGGRWLLAALLIGLTASCRTPPPDAYVGSAGKAAGAAAAVPVGKNTAGEPCRYQLASGGVAGGRNADLYCGNWDQPSGHITELPGAADPERLAAIAAAGPWRAYIGQHFRCGPPAPTRLLDNAPAELMQCTRRVGGWPQIALTALVGGHTFAADAVEPALPAVEAALASMSGQAAPARAAGGSEAERLIAQRGGEASFGSGDEGRFFQQLRLGDAYNNLNRPVEAERAYRDALAVQQKLLGPNNPAVALTVMKLAAQLAHEGNAGEAERLLTQAGALLAAHPDALLAAQLALYRAEAAGYEGKIPAAIVLAERAEAEFTALAPQAAAEAEGNSVGAVGDRGSLASLVSDQTPAISEQQTAVQGLAEAMRLHATLLQFSGRFAEARLLAQRTEGLLAASGLSVSTTAAYSFRLIASNQAIAGAYPSAAETSARAGDVFGRVTPNTCPEAANLLDDGWYRLKSGRPDAALASFRKAGAILRGPNGGCSIRADTVVPWLDALDSAAGDRAKLDAEMFEAAQFARTGATAQSIARATEALILGNPKARELARSLDDRKAAVRGLEQQHIAAGQEKAPAARLADIEKKLEAAEKARDEAEQALEAVGGYRYSQAEERPVTLLDVQKLLGPKEALAFFFVARDGSYGFLVRPGGVTAYKVPLSESRIHELVDRLRDTTIAKPAGLPTPDLAAAYQLYSALFGPAERQLAGVDRVTVAATGDLLRYPLEALVTRPGVTVRNGDYRQVPFLVRQLALAYVPAPRILVNIRSHRAAEAGLRPFIGFGDFRPARLAQLAASFPPQRCGGDARLLQQLQPLPDTRNQVETIARELGAGPRDIVLADAFTKARLARPDLAQYRIVLLATHGFFPGGVLNCMSDPAIVVSAPPDAPNAAGEFETPGDIQQLKLNADLVALSACNTSGAGSGDSLGGLARAFFVAGAHGLLVTHWDIVTPVSVPLMEGTFGRGAQDSAQALRAAQLQMIDSAGSSPERPIEMSDPNYWAAFVLIGDGVRPPPGA
jgi:CHAT domain-containing protein